MTAKELIAYEVDNVGYQIGTVLETMPAGLQKARLTEAAMTPRESVGHLSEAYQAVITEKAGEKYEWGSFKLEDKPWAEILEDWRALRSQASEAVLVDDEKWLKEGYGYIVAHDAYHVGQLSLLRLQHDPDWDPYSIYRS